VKPSDADRRTIAAAAAMAEIRPTPRADRSPDEPEAPVRWFTFGAGPPVAQRRDED
jgi:hypothetical protein